MLKRNGYGLLQKTELKKEKVTTGEKTMATGQFRLCGARSGCNARLERVIYVFFLGGFFFEGTKKSSEESRCSNKYTKDSPEARKAEKWYHVVTERDVWDVRSPN